MTVTKNNNSLIRRMVKARWAYLFLLPLFVGLLVFCYYPPIYGIALSFFEKGSATDAVFAGFQNYSRLFSDTEFLNSIPTMFYIMLPKLAISVVVPLIMAEMIFAVKSKKVQGVYRVLILVPIVAPGIVNLLIWRNIYDPTNGLLSTFLKALHIIPEDKIINWLTNPDIVIFSIVFMGFPWIGGTNVLIYMSGLMNISTEVIEASRLDGASTMRRIFVIDLPLLAGQIRYFVVFGIIGGFQDYGVQYALTQGDYNTMVPGYYMYRTAFNKDELGYASTIGTVIFLVIALVTALTFRLLRRKEDV